MAASATSRVIMLADRPRQPALRPPGRQREQPEAPLHSSSPAERPRPCTRDCLFCPPPPTPPGSSTPRCWLIARRSFHNRRSPPRRLIATPAPPQSCSSWSRHALSTPSSPSWPSPSRPIRPAPPPTSLPKLPQRPTPTSLPNCSRLRQSKPCETLPNTRGTSAYLKSSPGGPGKTTSVRHAAHISANPRIPSS